MKKIFIKYNPYYLETKFTIDGKSLPTNSEINARINQPDVRLQEWIEDLPQLLIDECNDKKFDIQFHGTILDYEDVKEVFECASNEEKLEVKLDRIPAKETSEKESLIEDVFKEIQNGPIDELRDEKIINAFNNAKNSEFEICVVATMSAGKSTLINSMLGDKMMPSSQEACTAIITRIKDVDSNVNWHAKVFGKDNELLESVESLTYEEMDRFNRDSKVSLIQAEGNIPFVTSQKTSLVLIDTPGPNNSRDKEHEKVQSRFLGKSSKALVLYIMEGTYGNNDDNELLRKVAESMKSGGKQSKDRFLFVINKVDDRKQEDSKMEDMLLRIKDYLQIHGVKNPNLYPAAALPALNIRLMQSHNDILDEDILDETEFKVKKLNRNVDLHLEKYSSLPLSLRRKIDSDLEIAKNNGDVFTQALIHTGIVSVETAIRQYVEKYAKTAKIKNIVDTFKGKLEAVSYEQEMKKEIAKNEEECEKITAQISSIESQIKDGKNAQVFKKEVSKALKKVKKEIEEKINQNVEEFQNELLEIINTYGNDDIPVEKISSILSQVSKKVKSIEANFQVALEGSINTGLISTSKYLLEEYKTKLSSLTKDIDLKNLSGVFIDPLKLMSGSVPSIDSLNIDVEEKEEVVGEEWIENTNKKWWKFWTWFDDPGHYITKYKTVKYVLGSELAQEMLAPIEDTLIQNGESALKQALYQSQRIAEKYEKEFVRLDDVLTKKLRELKQITSDKTNKEKLINDAQGKLNWLDNIKKRVDSILEI